MVGDPMAGKLRRVRLYNSIFLGTGGAPVVQSWHWCVVAGMIYGEDRRIGDRTEIAFAVVYVGYLWSQSYRFDRVYEISARRAAMLARRFMGDVIAAAALAPQRKVGYAASK